MKESNNLFSVDVKRNFLPADFSFKIKEDLMPFYDNLRSQNIDTVDDLLLWLKNRSEIEAMVQENVGWRYIRMSCNTADQELAESYNYFVTEIQPYLTEMGNQLDQKLLASKALSNLNDPRFEIAIRQIKMRVQMFRQENLSLLATLQTKEQIYSTITAAMTVNVDGKEITLQNASNFLELHDRNKREEVYRKIMERRMVDVDKLDQLYDELIALRHQIACNAGFENFRDYMFAALGRFDYTPQDCFNFHEAVEKHIVPLVEKIELSHKRKLNLDVLKPWDMAAESALETPLRPSIDENDLIEKSIACFNRLEPFLGNCLNALKHENRFDLTSRVGKAPGGYNYPLYESGLPFIFMNSTNNLRDLVTIVHEGGHAVHSILNKPLELVDFKNIPSEVAELASMSMELLSMDHWDVFFDQPNDLIRARKKHLEDVLKGLPWIAAIDAFQHWVYLNPNHTAKQRNQEWNSIYSRFSPNTIDWSGLESYKEISWQKQLHIFEVPFYYIEYGFAQLGSIAIWKNFKNNPSTTLAQYKNALSLGYTTSIGEIYSTAGVQFDFSEEYVAELSKFVEAELNSLNVN